MMNIFLMHFLFRATKQHTHKTWLNLALSLQIFSSYSNLKVLDALSHAILLFLIFSWLCYSQPFKSYSTMKHMTVECRIYRDRETQSN